MVTAAAKHRALVPRLRATVARETASGKKSTSTRAQKLTSDNGPECLDVSAPTSLPSGTWLKPPKSVALCSTNSWTALRPARTATAATAAATTSTGRDVPRSQQRDGPGGEVDEGQDQHGRGRDARRAAQARHGKGRGGGREHDQVRVQGTGRAQDAAGVGDDDHHQQQEGEPGAQDGQ